MTNRLAAIGCVLLVTGGALFTTAVAASAAPSISFKQKSALGPPPGTSTNPSTAIVTVTGSGFTPSTVGAIFECSTAAPQPTIDMQVPSGSTEVDIGKIPVSCNIAGTVIKTTSTGAFPKGTQIGLVSGALGPPTTKGTDSEGNPPANDAPNFPCPPTAAQGSAGCALFFFDTAKEKASQAIQFSFQTTSSSSSSSSTTTTPGCTATSNSVTATNPKTGASATVKVDPATCLTGGQTVTVTAQGLTPNVIGSLLECSTEGSNAIYNGTAGATVESIASGTLQTIDLVGVPDKTGTVTIVASGGNATFNYTGVTVSGTNATFTGLSLASGTGSWTVAASAIVNTGQPYVVYLANAVPVSCSPIKTFTTNPDGTISTSNQQFTIVVGTTGPPCTAAQAPSCATDSSGGDAVNDAKTYPCPPTAAQQTAGVECVIAVGDLGGDKVPVPIQFASNATPGTTTTTTTASNAQEISQNNNSGSGGSSGGSGGSGGSGSLAFTGPGPLMWIMGTLGVIFVLVGLSFLVIVDAPRRFVYMAMRRLNHVPAHKRTRR